ncbi:MAG: protein-glutamate O-methyltransferase CheR [Marinilabiliales bacterium]
MSVTKQELENFLAELKKISKYDFTDYSVKSITRRVEKLLADNNMPLEGIMQKMKKDPAFLNKIVKDITVNTTELFRDPKVWNTLKYHILPKYQNSNEIAIWHPGCSSGQEVYSMIILLNELGLLSKAVVYGTDINEDMINDAKRGVYKVRFKPEYFENFDNVLNETIDNPDTHNKIPYEKYMEINKSNDSITMLPFLRQKPKFFVHDLVKDGNVFDIKFDIIMCRNVLIYFNNALQNKVFELFYDCLKEDSYLIIGLHESIIGYMSDKFIKNGLFYIKKSYN